MQENKGCLILVWGVSVLIAIGAFFGDSIDNSEGAIFIAVIATIIAIVPIIYFITTGIIIVIKNASEQKRLALEEKKRKEEEEKKKEEEEKRKAAELAYNKKIKMVKESSLMYTEISNINKKYTFIKDLKDINSYKATCLSKRLLENLDFKKLLLETLNNNELYYADLLKKLQINSEQWEKYENKYKELKIFSSESKMEDLSKTEYNYFENKIYQLEKLEKPIISTSIYFIASYTSPTGAKHYEQQHNFSFFDILNGLEKMKLERKNKQIEEEQKQLRLEEKRTKEKKLRELDKIEKQLTQKEQEINQKENEFKKATQGHIYSSKTEIQTENNKPTEQEETPYQKLKKLKNQFENNEISRAEFEEKRKALL